jgi:hypothetical protein
MDKQYFGKLIVSLFLSFKLFIIPVISFLIGFIKIITLKNRIKKAGNIYYRIDKKDKNKNYEFKIISYIILIIVLLLFIVNKIWYLSILLLSFILYSISDFISNEKYKNIYGIYENGIINYDKELIEWKNIHSYEINENNLFGYYKNGALFEYKNIENIDEIKSLFEKNRIMKR